MIFTVQNLWPSEPVPKTLLLNDVLAIARNNNPEIIAAEKKWRSMEARVGSESGWDRTTFSYETMYSNRERVIGVSQDIPFPGKLTLKGNIARREAFMSRESGQAKVNQITAQVKSAYAMLFLAHKSIEIYNQNADLMRRFAKVAESKYVVGKAGQVDVLKAQVELSKSLNMILTLEQEKETSQAMLNILLNQDPEQELGAPEEPKIMDIDWDYKKFSQIAVENRPELQGMSHHVHHSKAALTYARYDYLPDFMVQLKRRSADNPDMDGSNEFMVAAKIPLWFGKNIAQSNEAKYEAEMGLAEYQTMRNMTLWTVKDLLVKVKAAERLIKLYRTSVIPQTENALKITQTAYQSDRASFLDLIDVQRNLVQFQLEHYQHLADYTKMIAELEQVLGKPLTEVIK